MEPDSTTPNEPSEKLSVFQNEDRSAACVEIGSVSFSNDPASAPAKSPNVKEVRKAKADSQRPSPGDMVATRSSSSEAVIKRAILGEYIYSSIALILGLSSIIAGSILCIYGVTGHTSFTASLLGLNANFTDAAPGVVLFVVGLFMIWATRPKVKLGDLIG